MMLAFLFSVIAREAEPLTFYVLEAFRGIGYEFPSICAACCAENPHG